MKKFESLPAELQTEQVRPYYEALAAKRGQLFLKRAFDILVSAILLLLLSPILLFFAIWIKLDSPGSVFYRQERVTTYGRIFRIFKFRTMKVDADKMGSLVTLKNDDRITRVGHVIRRYRLDELPQLLNILTGDMSLVGTRPEVAKYVAAYTPEMKATLLLPAGVTSTASILFKDEEELIAKFILEGMEVDDIYITKVLPEKMHYNLSYLKNYSFLGDLKLMVRTVLKVFK
ncbi:sugar transferase [uncultured Abiotrophia sp.]|uniref:sugar transferase n=1 Tax=uncultured Abiotrophia sp. TaxID=316094 RepID=UPI0028E7C9B9|nr:sugar transferase [uncultured Abiotrophia sp.]